MTQPRTTVEAENRLERFNGERDQIIATVEDRVVKSYVDAARAGGDASLEYALNEVVFSEIKRLEKSQSKSRDRQLARWRDLGHRLNHMTEADKRGELRKIAHHYAAEVAGNFNPKVYRFANDILPPALSFLFSPIRSIRQGYEALGGLRGQIQCEGPIDLVRAACERGTLVFTPTHCSNLDSIALGFGLTTAQLPPVTYGAGKNLFSNPIISFFMHNLGAYQVDRRLQFKLYKDLLKQYSAVLLERGYHSLFFPGGTRSRSNRVEQKLKLGLLGTAVTAYQHNLRAGAPRRRIYVVPVTINYPLVLEGETLSGDFLEDEGKSRYIIDDDEFTRLGRVVEFMRKLLAHEGAVVLRFGRPVDLVGNETDDNGESLDRQGRRVDLASYFKNGDGDVEADLQRDAEYTRQLGRTLAKAYRRDTVYLPTHMAARAVFDAVIDRTGVRDIYRLLRLPTSAVSVDVLDVVGRLSSLRQYLAENPACGAEHDSSRSLPAMEVLEAGLRSLGSYHSHPAATRIGETIRVGDMKLLYYYQNRLSHVGEMAAQ